MHSDSDMYFQKQAEGFVRMCTERTYWIQPVPIDSTAVFYILKENLKIKTPTECHMLRQQVKEAAQKRSTSTMRCLRRCGFGNKQNKFL